MSRNATLSALAAMFATTLLLTVLTPSAAQAQATYNFSGNALPATLEESGGSPIYAGGVVIFPGSSDSDRRYLRTIANFNNTSFTAEVTVKVASGAGGVGMAFIGFGAGEANSEFFYEPMVAPNIYARIAPDDFGDGFEDDDLM